MLSEPDMVLALVKEVEVWRLANLDGCCCGRFSLRNVDVEFGCGKGGERAVWCSSRSMDYWDRVSKDGCDERLLRPIAEEVARQIEARDGRGPLKIYFHEQGAHTATSCSPA